MLTLLSQVATEVVIMTTYGATYDDQVGILTTPSSVCIVYAFIDVMAVICVLSFLQ